MGVSGLPDEIRRYGEMFRRVPDWEPKPRPVELPSPDGPLSTGLAGLQNMMASAADEFARTKDAGTIAAGDGLIQIAANLPEFDRQGADAIGRLFPDAAPGAGGGR